LCGGKQGLAPSQAQLIRGKSSYFRTSKIACYFDPCPEMTGQQIDVIKVKLPGALLGDDPQVMIGAVQRERQIHDQFEALGIDPSQLIENRSCGNTVPERPSGDIAAAERSHMRLRNAIVRNASGELIYIKFNPAVRW
jgi:hypothetical protein